MSQLVPCPSCGRHVRLPSATCPFCDVAIDAGALTAQYAPRRNGVQSGIKRAVIFAAGASMAAACGGETEGRTYDPDPTVQPVYGAPVDPTSGSDDTNGSAPPATSEPTAQPLYGAPVTSEPTAQPVYGAPINTDDDQTFAQPEYGAPVPPGSSSFEDLTGVQAIYGAPIPPHDAGGDAAAADGGDAGVEIDPTIDDPDPIPTVQPLYGAPALN
jgi:hypothetical protein